MKKKVRIQKLVAVFARVAHFLCFEFTVGNGKKYPISWEIHVGKWGKKSGNFCSIICNTLAIIFMKIFCKVIFSQKVHLFRGMLDSKTGKLLGNVLCFDIKKHFCPK